MTQLSKNFSVKELTKSSTATRLGIDNTPNIEQTINLTHLAINVLQPVRDHHGSTTVSSGLRVLELNRAVGSSDTSQHMKGEAADMECPGVDNLELAKWMAENLEFDQIILEGYEEGDTNSGWIHVSFKADGSNRKKLTTATFINGKAKYTNGLPA